MRRHYPLGRLTASAILFPAALSGVARAAVDVTSIVTSTYAGPAGSYTDVNGAGIRSSSFPTGSEYDLSYTGQIKSIDKITTSLGSFFATQHSDIVFRRTATPNNDITWFMASGSSTSSALTLYGPAVKDSADAFTGNNVNLGVDNLFANRADINGNYSNIERLDFVFKNGIAVAGTRGFTIFDRGNLNDHDSFGIVAITGIDADGNPTSLGSLKKFGTGNWGNTSLASQQDYIVMRRDLNDDEPFAPSAIANNSLGGVFIPLTDLATTGQTIYGFALVGGDVNGNGNALLNWQNNSVFPNDTLHDNVDAAGHRTSTSPGGLDPTATIGMLFDVAPLAVPEPASAGLAMLSLGALALRRQR